ncbi:hypothetical protein JCM10908_000501 [Rhodotorula pacifica]|uniref:uncharacterized protein n=1 Tax=Rhodotorula pacifica TaxID=1495444 RepID=UPI003170D2FD
MLLDRVTLPPLVSLFSSTSSAPLLLASTNTAPNTPESFISLLEDATDSKETLVAWQPSGPDDLATRVASLAKQRQHPQASSSTVIPKDLQDQVLHLQAPDCRTTSVTWGSLHKGKWREDGLGVELPVMHLQLKDLGQAMFVDVAVADEQGELLIVRASTWQNEPKLYPGTPAEPPILHLPLRFPSSSTTTTPLLTAWTTISFPLARILQTLDPPRRYKAATGVRVHATCRLRRIWFSEEDMPSEIGPDQLRRGVLPELALFAAKGQSLEVQ